MSTATPSNGKLARQLDHRQRQAKALQLRLEGRPWQQVADLAGYAHVSSAHKAVKTALDRVPKANAEQYRALEEQRLDELTRLASEATRPAEGGVNLDAVRTLVRISERRSKLLGLDHNEARNADALQRASEAASIDWQKLTHALYTALTNAGLTADEQTRVVDLFNEQLEKYGLGDA